MAKNGLSSFQRRMKAIPEKAKQLARPALIKEGQRMAGDMRHLVPKDTGNLEESIKVTGPGEKTPPYSQPGGSRVAGDLETIVTAGDSLARYAHLVEYGTVHAGAKPFFWPSFRLNRKGSSRRIKRAIAKAIKETKNG